MQRQSLGSPNSKLQSHGEVAGSAAAAEEIKAEKVIRSRPKPEKSIHLIPLLTLLCFLVLYLFSHNPSPADLPSIGGAISVLEKNVVLGDEIRSHRGLKAAGRLRRSRKLGGGVS